MGALVLADPGNEARTGSMRRFAVPALLVIGWAGLFAYSAAYLTEDMPFRSQGADARQAVAVPRPPSRRVVMLDMPDDAIPDVQRPDAARDESARQTAQATPRPAIPSAQPPIPATLSTPRATSSAAGAEFVGIWGPTADACASGSRRRGYIPATITPDRARAGRTICNFHDSRHVGSAWLMAAECSDRGRHWSSQVRLLVDGDRLTWSSGRGTATYVRCSRRGG